MIKKNVCHGIDVDNIQVITDHIDESIKSSYVKRIADITGIERNLLKKWTEYNYISKEITKRQFGIEIQANFPAAEFISRIKWSLNVCNNELTFAADIIANSIRYLEKYAIESEFSGLNNVNAIKCHPLHKHMVGMSKDPDHLAMVDRLYMHRKCKFEPQRLG